MVLLALESTLLYDHLIETTRGTFIQSFFEQFVHHPWNGLRFWDLIQPLFMFIAGTAMAYSIHKQRLKGFSWMQSLKKALKRSGWLFFWGVLDYAVRDDGLSFELWNVLTQLSFTMLVAFLIFDWQLKHQLILSVLLLWLTEALYRYTGIEGFDQPFTDQHNFGNFMDLVLMNTINSDGWVAINCIPTAAHTIWGAVAGKLLINLKDKMMAVKLLLIFGFVGLVAGYAMDVVGITPIIKRISTSSFTLASGGWCFVGLAWCYWWIDVKNHRGYLQFFTIVGMNSIFIYLFFEIVGHRWFNDYVGAITNGLMALVNVPFDLMMILTSIFIFLLEWLLCYFLYTKRIFFKL